MTSAARELANCERRLVSTASNVIIIRWPYVGPKYLEEMKSVSIHISPCAVLDCG